MFSFFPPSHRPGTVRFGGWACVAHHRSCFRSSLSLYLLLSCSTLYPSCLSSLAREQSSSSYCLRILSSQQPSEAIETTFFGSSPPVTSKPSAPLFLQTCPQPSSVSDPLALSLSLSVSPPRLPFPHAFTLVNE